MKTVESFIFMDGPSREVMGVLFKRSWMQFRMSWYIFFFLMPVLPEYFFQLFDFEPFNCMLEGTQSVTEEDLEAFKYVFSGKKALKYPIDYYRANILISDVTPPTIDPCVPGLYLLGEKDPFICKESGTLLQKHYKDLQFTVVEGNLPFNT